MKEEEQQITIAKACGWKGIHKAELEGPCGVEDFQHTEWTSPDGEMHGCVPEYTKNLNAMHDAESILTQKQAIEYYSRLALIRGRDYRLTHKSFDYNTASATATQRAEAFLRTISKWKE